MGQNRRWADVAVDAVLGVQDELADAQRLTDQILADGVVTPEEATRLRAAMTRCATGAAVAVTAAERANVAELIAASITTVAPLNAHVRRQAAEVGLPVVELPAPLALPPADYDAPQDAA